MALSAGEKAPNFSLFNSEKTKITLSDFEGSKNVLLLFFPSPSPAGGVGGDGSPPPTRGV